MSWKPAPIIGGAYSDDAKAWSCQDTVNWIPVAAERSGSRTPTMLRGAPGMRTFCITGSGQPIRGAHNVEGLLLVVSGTTLYRVSTLGAATALGTIPGVERVSMAHNQITGGSEVAIANGQGGYVYNTVTGTLTQITDDGFPGAIRFDFCDGYIMGVEPGRRFAFHSQLAAAGDYNTLDRYEAEGSPDKLVGQIVTHREWWLFGERTIEPYVNTGEATGTFQRSSGTVIEVGAASRNAIVQMDNSVFWLGNDGVVYRANGYAPQRISTHAIEQAISRCNLAQAFAFTFEDRGHKIFYLTFPDGMTWGYDAASSEWHRRKSDGLDRWRINTLTRWNGRWIAGDYTNGKLYELNWDVQDEDHAVLERRRVTGVLSDNQNRVTVDGVALVFDTGVNGSPKLLLPPLDIAGHLPSELPGIAVSYQYDVSGGLLPRVVSIDTGALPAGLDMDPTGLVTGQFADLVATTWTVKAIDADGSVATLTDSYAPIATYANWDSMTVPSNGALSTDLATLSATNSTTGSVFSSVPITGKCYFEAHVSTTISIDGAEAGVASTEFDRRVFRMGEGSGNSLGVGCPGGTVKASGTVLGTLGGAVLGSSMRLRFAVDGRKIWVGCVGQSTWVGGGDPASGTTPTYTMPGTNRLFPGGSINQAGSATVRYICNPSDFTGAVPAGFSASLWAPLDDGYAATLDPIVTNPDCVLSNGNLTGTNTGSALRYAWTVSTRIKRTGKPYWEVVAKSGVNTQDRCVWGILNEGSDYPRYFFMDAFLRGYGLGASGAKYVGVTDSALTTGINTGDVIRNRFDIDTGTYEIAVNGGPWLTIATGITGPGWRVAMASYYGVYSAEGGTFNFGASAFAYPVPTGYDAGWLKD